MVFARKDNFERHVKRCKKWLRKELALSEERKRDVDVRMIAARQPASE